MTTKPSHPGLTFRILDPDDAPLDLLDGYLQAFSRGFHDGRVPVESREHWLDHVRADRVTLRGAWPEEPVLGGGVLPVATFSSWDATLNAGRRTLPARLISDVTVSPTHRRQGLLRTLMTVDLADAAAEGAPLAALTASEGSIYGRFGFGLATFTRHLEVDVTARFRLREDVPADDGSVVLLEPAEAWTSVAAVFAGFHERNRGSVARPQFYEPWLTAVWNFDRHAADPRLRTAVHLDAAGIPDGYVVYEPEGKRDAAGLSWLRVVDFATTTARAYRRLWRFLADVDMVDRVSWHKAPLDDPLPWALAEPFAVRTTRVDPLLWVRVLDLPTALAARPWGADGVCVIEVDDPLGHTTGRWRIAVEAGTAEVTPTGAEPDVRLGADTLGALYLGGVPTTALTAAGRLIGSAGSLANWAAICDVGPTPYCITGF